MEKKNNRNAALEINAMFFVLAVDENEDYWGKVAA
jgi:hypothetical protein